MHLVCKYYKLRQKAKDGRLFIHPEYKFVKGRGYENTGRFDNKRCLLTYCNHKPRQKHYQLLYDLAGVLQVDPEYLREVIKSKGSDTDEKCLIDWLKNDKFKGLKTYTEKASKAQKDYRGELKSLMNDAVNKKSGDLYKLHKKINELSNKIGESLFGTVDEVDEDAKKSFDQKIQKFNSVFSFAQINNIAFKERGGNAKTCAVCSLDNAHRMTQVSLSTNEKETTAKAQRLPAIETRLIDGAVMRMARIVSDAIAKDQWKKIENDLAQDYRVHIPIITESNRFEFEPSLTNLKGNDKKKDKKNKKDKKSKTQEDIYQSKEERIKDANQKKCPYTGNSLDDSGEVDHIIPRASQYGTLNDEANLIYASKEGNEKKGNQKYTLRSLNLKYKQEQFKDCTNDKEIKNWIMDKIGDGESEDFKFGRYRSFINLTSDEQKAFRHALFFETDHPLRQKVIKAIGHRSKAFVNGTQRYFAEVLANRLYKKAKAIKKQHLLSFDYFGVQAQSSTRGDGIYDLRQCYEEAHPDFFNEYKKDNNKQKPYSHLIDAQLAFAMVADQHKKEGSLKLKIDDGISLWPFDKDTGEISKKNIFNAIKILSEAMQRDCLERRKPYDVETHHRQLLTEGKKKQIRISYKIHRDNSIGERFFPLLKDKDGNIKKGFHPNNSIEYKKEDFTNLSPFLKVSEKSKNKNYQVWTINKRKAQEFLLKIGRNSGNKNEKKIARLLDDLSYQTIKKEISKALTGKNNKPPQPKTVKDAQENWDKCIKKDDFKKDEINLPFYGVWQKLKSELDEADSNQDLQDFLKNCSLFQNEINHDHQKARKVYSLPVKASIGNIRLQRKTWHGDTIIQTVAEESLSKYGYDGKDRPYTILSKNSVPKKYYLGLPSDLERKPQPREWIPIPLNEIEDNDITIQKAEIINQDANRCKVKISVDFETASYLSIPNKNHWKGKIICHTTNEKLEEAIEKDTNNYHYLNTDYRWFSEPFKLPMEKNKSREVKVEKTSNHALITFTVSKTQQLKRWLNGE